MRGKYKARKERAKIVTHAREHEECPVGTVVDVAVLQLEVKNMKDRLVKVEEDVQVFKNERIRAGAYATALVMACTGVFGLITFITSNNVIAQVTQIVNHNAPPAPVPSVRAP